MRVEAARGLADAYLLGDHLGTDPVPGIRAFVKDADPFVRKAMLSALAMYDSPLARELLFKHHVGAISVPRGSAGAEIHAEASRLLRRYATPEQISTLEQGGAGAQRAWFDDAEDHPASSNSHRFETGELKVGVANRIELSSAPGTYLWFKPVHTMYATEGWITSGDSVMLCLGVPEGGRTEGGGAAIYGGGISSVTSGGSAITHARYLGDGIVRYWIRVSPSGRSLKHVSGIRRTLVPR